MTNDSKLVIWFASDFGGCGHLRSLWINEALNSYYGSRKLYEGFACSRFLVDANILKIAKVFHFQRQITDHQLDYIKFIVKFKNDNKMSAPIIYDCDDRFSDIPDFNYARPFFNNEHLLDNFRQILNLVDIVTVTTDEMADWIKSYNGTAKVKVVPNFIPKYVYRPYDFEKKPNTKPKIIWAGSANHYSDVHMGDFTVINDLINNTIDEFDWNFVGIRKLPKWLEHLGSKVKIAPWSPIVGFPNMLKTFNADFGIAPLIQDIFNESKSNIKLLDYWSADLITITSKMKPYAKENELFFSGDWKIDSDMILDTFNNEQLKKDMINRQRHKLEKYYLENNLNVYMDLFGLKY